MDIFVLVPVEGRRRWPSPGAGVSSSCELPNTGLEIKPRSSAKAAVLITAEPVLQPIGICTL